MEPSSSPVAAGDVVAGKYRVERVIGVGGMGVVVAATHQQLDQRVALKFLLPEVAAHPEVVQRFIREARASVKIQSEHVARVLDVGALDDGTPYMVMEYLEGEDLAQTLSAHGALPVAQAVGYVLEACEALAEAHALGMVHRDLKPANLFLARKAGGRPVVKVLDFGISKVPASERDPVKTQAQTLMGSPGYMSPEQMISAATVDVRSDIWSMGIVVYELLGQRLPFTGDTMPELVASILQKAPAPIGEVRADVPVGLQAVVDTCLQKDPARRYANVGELARALGPFGPARAEQSVERIEQVLGLAHESIRPPAFAPQTTGPGVALQPAGVATFSPTTSHGARPASRFVVPGIAAALFVIAGVGFVGWRATRAGAGHATLDGVPTALVVTASAPSAGPVASTPSATPSAAPPAASSATLPSAPMIAPAPAPTVAPSKPRPRPAATAAPTPTCHVVSYFDADGNKHFKEECP